MDLQHSTLEPSCCTGIQSKCGRRVLSSCIRICFEQILSSYICITFFLNKTHFQPTIIILYMHQNWFSTNYYHMYYICIRISFEQLLSYYIYICIRICFQPTSFSYHFSPHQPHFHGKTQSWSVYNVLLTPLRRGCSLESRLWFICCLFHIFHFGFVTKHWQIQMQNHRNKCQLSRAINLVSGGTYHFIKSNLSFPFHSLSWGSASFENSDQKI